MADSVCFETKSGEGGTPSGGPTGWRTLLHLVEGDYGNFQIVPWAAVYVVYPGGQAASEGAADWPLFCASTSTTRRFRVTHALSVACVVNVRTRQAVGIVGSWSRVQQVVLASGSDTVTLIEVDLVDGEAVSLHFGTPNGTPHVTTFRVEEQV